MFSSAMVGDRACTAVVKKVRDFEKCPPTASWLRRPECRGKKRPPWSPATTGTNLTLPITPMGILSPMSELQDCSARCCLAPFLCLQGGGMSPDWPALPSLVPFKEHYGDPGACGASLARLNLQGHSLS